MVDQDVFASRLSTLEGYRVKLESFQRFGREDFLADEDIYQLAARYLQLACECILDITQHVIAEEGFRQPTDYKDAACPSPLTPGTPRPRATPGAPAPGAPGL